MFEYFYLVLPSLLEGLKLTLLIFIVSLLLSIPLGVAISLLRTSENKAFKNISKGYILLMRGTPLLLQIIVIFYGLPLVGIVFNRFTAVIVAFTFNYGAYFAEIFRSGIESIDGGQIEASRVLGLDKKTTFFKIILPQVIKNVLPPISNEVITLIKDTALVYAVGMSELLRFAKIASNRDATLLPLLLVGGIYLILTAVLSKGFNKLEESFAYYN